MISHDKSIRKKYLKYVEICLKLSNVFWVCQELTVIQLSASKWQRAWFRRSCGAASSNLQCFFFFLRFSYLEDFSNHQIDVSFLVRLDKVIFCVQTGSQLLIEAGDTRLSSIEKDRMLALDLTES